MAEIVGCFTNNGKGAVLCSVYFVCVCLCDYLCPLDSHTCELIYTLLYGLCLCEQCKCLSFLYTTIQKFFKRNE